MATDFATWLNNEIDKQNLSFRELASRAGLSHTIISEVVNGKRRPGCRFCIQIARPLGLRGEQVLRLAAHLQELANPSALDRALASLAADLPAAQLKRDLRRERAQVQDLTAQRHRLALALATGKMDPDIYATTDEGIAGRLHAAQDRAAELSRSLDALPDLQEKKKALAALARAFPSLLEQADPAEVAALLQAAGVRMLCDSGHVVAITP